MQAADTDGKWTLKLSPAPECSIGCSNNESVSKDGSTTPRRANEDRFYTCYFQDSIQLYMVLDGHDGTKAVEFARPHIPHFLLQRDFSGGEKAVLDAFRSAIINTEQAFFSRIDRYVTRKLALQMEIEKVAPDASSGMALQLFPEQITEIGRLDELIKGGTTVVAALIYDNKLYVANVGDSRALLCSQNSDGTLARVEQLSVDHNTSNNDELCRLEKCGLDPNQLRRNKRLGMQQNTRCIGDHSIKGGYHNVDILRHAMSQPGIADPHLHRAVDLSTFDGFLILMSDGLYEAYGAWTGRPDTINTDIARLVVKELAQCPDLAKVAQSVVEKVKRSYCDTCKRDQCSGRLDDITLVVKRLVALPPPLPPHPHRHGSNHEMHNYENIPKGTKLNESKPDPVTVSRETTPPPPIPPRTVKTPPKTTRTSQVVTPPVTTPPAKDPPAKAPAVSVQNTGEPNTGDSTFNEEEARMEMEMYGWSPKVVAQDTPDAPPTLTPATTPNRPSSNGPPVTLHKGYSTPEPAEPPPPPDDPLSTHETIVVEPPQEIEEEEEIIELYIKFPDHFPTNLSWNDIECEI